MPLQQRHCCRCSVRFQTCGDCCNQMSLPASQVGYGSSIICKQETQWGSDARATSASAHELRCQPASRNESTTAVLPTLTLSLHCQSSCSRRQICPVIACTASGLTANRADQVWQRNTAIAHSVLQGWRRVDHGITTAADPLHESM